MAKKKKGMTVEVRAIYSTVAWSAVKGLEELSQIIDLRDKQFPLAWRWTVTESLLDTAIKTTLKVIQTPEEVSDYCPKALAEFRRIVGDIRDARYELVAKMKKAS